MLSLFPNLIPVVRFPLLKPTCQDQKLFENWITYETSQTNFRLSGTTCEWTSWLEAGALEPLAVVPATGRGPFATRLRHGWTLYSPLKVCPFGPEEVTCNRVWIQETERYRELMGPTAVLTLLELDFQDCKIETYPEERALSREDCKLLEVVEWQRSLTRAIINLRCLSGMKMLQCLATR